jgi:hypothetical protein
MLWPDPVLIRLLLAILSFRGRVDMCPVSPALRASANSPVPPATEKSSLVEPFNLFAQGVVPDDAFPSNREDEHPLAALGRAFFSRREYSPRWLATAVFHSVSEQSQFGKDFTQSEADVSFHIFKEDVSGSNNLNCPPHKWPEVPRVVAAFALAGGTERLAWVARNEDVHQVSKEFAWESFTSVQIGNASKSPASIFATIFAIA